MWIFGEKKVKVWDDSTGALWTHNGAIGVDSSSDLQQPSHFKWYSLFEPMYGKRQNTSHVLFDSMLMRGAGGFWSPSSNLKKDIWCYAISWCAMFVLYTGSGEMLLLTMDSGMDWLSVVFFCRLSHGMTLWCHAGTDDVTLLSVGCWWGHSDDNNECCWM